MVFSVDSKSESLKSIPKLYLKLPAIFSGKGALKTVHKMSANIAGRNEEDQEEGRKMQADSALMKEDKKERKLPPKEVKEEEKKEVKMLHPRKEVVFSSLPFAHALTIQVHFK